MESYVSSESRYAKSNLARELLVSKVRWGIVPCVGASCVGSSGSAGRVGGVGGGFRLLSGGDEGLDGQLHFSGDSSSCR